MGLRLFTQRGEEFRRCRDDPTGPQDGLHDHGGQVVGMLADGGTGTINVVVVEHDRFVRRVDGRAAATEIEQPAVIAAPRDRDARATGDHASQGDGHEIGLGARVGEAHEFEGRESVDECAGKARLVDVVSGEADAIIECRSHRIKDGLLAMAVEASGVLPQHVDVLMPIYVDNTLRRAARDAQRERRVVEHGAGVAARHDLAGVNMHCRADRSLTDVVLARLRQRRVEIRPLIGRRHGPRVRPSGEEVTRTLGHIDSVLAQRLDRDDPQCRGVRGGEHHRRCGAVTVGVEPPRCADAPAVAGLEAGKAVLRHRCHEVVAASELMLEELRGHHSAHRVGAQVIRARRAAAVAIEAGERVAATLLEWTAEHIERLRHGISVPRHSRHRLAGFSPLILR